MATRKGTGGLVSSPPMSPLKCLRSLEKAYTLRSLELDKANEEIVILKKELQLLKQSFANLTSKK